jgi:hypothetical protein
MLAAAPLAAAAALLLLLASQLTGSEKVTRSWKPGVSAVGLTETFASMTVGGLVSRITCTVTQQDTTVVSEEHIAQSDAFWEAWDHCVSQCGKLCVQKGLQGHTEGQKDELV